MSGQEVQHHKAVPAEKQLDIKLEHPSQIYSINEFYSIRRESMANSNEHIYKKLGRCFQRVKKLKSSNQERQLTLQYEVDNSKVRKDFRRIHQLFNNSSKAPSITRKKIDKMKTRVEKVKGQMHRDEIHLSREIDISKMYNKNYVQKGNSTQPDKKG